MAGQQEPAGHGGHKMSAVAWSWAQGDEIPEVLDCRNGRPIHALQVAGVTKVSSERPGVQWGRPAHAHSPFHSCYTLLHSFPLSNCVRSLPFPLQTTNLTPLMFKRNK